MKIKFPWVDNVAEIRDQRRQDELNRLLVERLNVGETEGIWAAIPEIVDWPTFSSFRFGSYLTGIENDDINLDALIESLNGAPLTLETLMKKRVYCLAQGERFPVRQWTFFDCMIAEVDTGGMLHILNAGTWHQVNPSFADQVRSDCLAIPTSNVVLPDWGDETEGEYNLRVSEGAWGNYALMDCRMVKHDGMPSPIEFCDLISDEKQIIHVKRYSQSSVLSHLFAQGHVSASCFLSDPQFRQCVNALLPESHQLPVASERIAASEFEIVFAIGHKRPNAMKLPFFSQVTLRSTYRALHDLFGFQVGIKKIPMSKLTDIGKATVRRHARGIGPMRATRPPRVIRT